MFYLFWRTFLLLSFFCFVFVSPALAKDPLVKLGWDANPEVRVSGYNVYRSSDVDKEAVLLNPGGPVLETFYVDRSVKKGATYNYLVTAVDLQGLESTYSNSLTVAVPEKHVPKQRTLFLPASLPADQPCFADTFVGIGLLNIGDLPDQVSITGIDSQGLPTGYQLVTEVLPHGKGGTPPDQLAAVAAGTAGMLGRTSSDIHSFFLAGTKDLRSFEGITEPLEPGTTLHFPIALSETGSAILGLFNPDEGKDAEIEVTAWNSDGTQSRKTTLVLPPLGMAQRVLNQLFGENFQLTDGYVTAVSNQPVEGYQISSFDSQSLSALPAQTADRAQRLSLPHFFYDDSGGETEIRLTNTEESEVEVSFSVLVDGSTQPQLRTLIIPARAQSIARTRTLLGREGIPGVATGHLEITATRRDGGEMVYARVIAEAIFVGKAGSARTSVPLRRQGTDTWVFPTVMQSRETGLNTGLALLNRKNESLALTVRALDDQGNLTAERTIDLPAGQRLIGQLDTELFFGPSFSQTGGHLEVSGDRSFIAMSIFGDAWVEFLSHIGPVQR